MVPVAGTPKARSEIVQAVESQPPIYAALAPRIAASAPCARLDPNSLTSLPFAARRSLAAFVAIVLLFLLLYPTQQKRALMLMGTLGASAWGKFMHTFVSILCILIPGAALGGYAGSKLWTRIAAALMEWINIEIALESDMTAIAPKLTAASLAVVALAALIVSAALCRNRGLMKRK